MTEQLKGSGRGYSWRVGGRHNGWLRVNYEDCKVPLSVKHLLVSFHESHGIGSFSLKQKDDLIIFGG